MPFDYTYMSCAVSADIWEQSPNIDPAMRVSVHGEVKDGGTMTANTIGLRLIIGREEWGKRCSVKGSLPIALKGHNRDRFMFAELLNLVKNMADQLHINPETTLIHSLELQINLFLDEPPQTFIKAAITHKGKAFNEINPRQPNVGRIVAYDDREIKIYDKVKADLLKAKNKAERDKIKASISNPNILRFGVAVKKMRYLERCQIKTLSDLVNLDKAIKLTSVLYNEIKHIKFFDHQADISVLTELQRLKWERFSNPFFWSDLDYRKRESASKMFARISAKLETRKFNDELVKLCFDEYLQIFEAHHPKKWRCLHLLHEALKNSEAEKMAVFTHLSSYVQSPPCGLHGGHPIGKNNSVKNNPQKSQFPTRKCVVCGRDISHQKTGSKFCSEKLYGKQAKQCRNKASNQSRNQRAKQKRLQEYQLIQNVFDSGIKNMNLIVTVGYPDRNINHRPKIISLTRWEREKIKQVISIRFTKVGTVTYARARRFIRMLKKRQYLNQ